MADLKLTAEIKRDTFEVTVSGPIGDMEDLADVFHEEVMEQILTAFRLKIAQHQATGL